MLSNTADSPLHCLKSNLKCLSFLPLVFLVWVGVKLKLSRSLFSSLSLSWRALCFSHSFVTFDPLCQYLCHSILFTIFSLEDKEERKVVSEKVSHIIDNIFSLWFSWMHSCGILFQTRFQFPSPFIHQWLKAGYDWASSSDCSSPSKQLPRASRISFSSIRFHQPFHWGPWA